MTDTAAATPTPSTVTTPTGGVADPIAITARAAPTVEAAHARRNEILNNPELSAKYFKGDVALREEVHKLNSVIADQDLASVIQSSLNGVPPSEFSNVTTDGVLAKHEYASAAQSMIPALGSSEAYEAFASGRAFVTEAKRAEAVQMKKMILSDRDWVAQYIAGSESHRQQMLRINAVLSCRIEEEKQK
jgi:hypothetical protein